MNLPQQLKQEVTLKTAHQIERVKMRWLTNKDTGEFKPVKELTPDHLKRIRWYLSKSGLTQINGYTKQNWVNCIEEELRYRSKLVNTIFNVITLKDVETKDGVVKREYNKQFKNIQYI